MCSSHRPTYLCVQFALYCIPMVCKLLWNLFTFTLWTKAKQNKIVWNKFHRGGHSSFVCYCNRNLRTFLERIGTVYRNVFARSSHSIDKCWLEIFYRRKLGVFFLFHFLFFIIFSLHIFGYLIFFSIKVYIQIQPFRWPLATQYSIHLISSHTFICYFTWSDRWSHNCFSFFRR